MNSAISYRNQYGLGTMSEVTIDGIKYQVGPLQLSSGKEIVLCTMVGSYQDIDALQIMSALTNIPYTEELAHLNGSRTYYKLFKYTTHQGKKFIVVRQPNDDALSAEEINHLWSLL